MKAENDRRMQTMEGQIRALSEKHTAFEEKQNRLETGQNTFNSTISGNATKAEESHYKLLDFLEARLGSPRAGPGGTEAGGTCCLFGGQGGGGAPCSQGSRQILWPEQQPSQSTRGTGNGHPPGGPVP
jgi:hypothetical protein